MRKSYVQIDGVLYEKGHEPQTEVPMVFGDIEPYQSMVTGEMITSRSKHREHLREHGLREIGNEVDKLYTAYDRIPDVAPQQRKEIIRAQIDSMSHDQFKRMLKRDLDEVRWNSRKE